jgi:transposase
VGKQGDESAAGGSMKRKKLTQEQALELQAQGLNKSQIARQCGVSRRTVIKVLGDQGLAAYKYDWWLQYRPDDVAKMVEERAAGDTLAIIAERYNISTMLAKKILSTNGQGIESESVHALKSKEKFWQDNSPFGLLTVRRLERGAQGLGIKADCICECGRKKKVQLRYLREGSILSCGKGGCMITAKAISGEARQRLIDLDLMPTYKQEATA